MSKRIFCEFSDDDLLKLDFLKKLFKEESYEETLLDCINYTIYNKSCQNQQ